MTPFSTPDRFVVNCPAGCGGEWWSTDAQPHHRPWCPLPFPGAFPGPVVGAPTWGAYLRDVPDQGYEVYRPQPPLVEDIWTPSAETEWAPNSWALVRRTPQPKHVFSDDEPTFCYTHDRHCGDPLRSALGLIDRHGCETFTRSRCLDPNSGRSRDAEYGAEKWCDACIARDALNAVEVLVENEETAP